MSTRVTRFVVSEAAHKRLTCNRCHRALRKGEQAVTTVTANQAAYRHAGRSCPPSSAYWKDS
jgi:hypothetical protein